MEKLKLNNKRTFLVGLAFLSICAFWQMYDNVVPLILRETFNMDESLTGVIMAADNVLALFLLPLFGGLSDRTETRLGRRTPFIIVGTVLAVVLMNVLPFLDNSYSAGAARWKLISFVITLGLLLVAMGVYRSPAVALMPDVTPKPLRSRANAIINLMGAVGGIIYLGITALLYPESKTDGAAHVDYQPLFLIVSVATGVAGAGIAIYYTLQESRLWFEAVMLLIVMPFGVMYVLLLGYSVLALLACPEMFAPLGFWEKTGTVLFNPLYLLEYVPIYIMSRRYAKKNTDGGWQQTARVEYDTPPEEK